MKTYTILRNVTREPIGTITTNRLMSLGSMVKDKKSDKLYKVIASNHKETYFVIDAIVPPPMLELD